MQLTGAEILLECLIEQNVDTIFGYPGGSVLPIYDALYKYKDKINHYLTSHEQGAAHAADGYARSTGKVGVCLATSGPGATNLVTGIATAYMDSSPIVAITGNVPVPMLGKDSFQEVDTTGITMPITKHNFIVKDVAELADTIRQAFHIAKSGRPGPVLVDIPKDVATFECNYSMKTPIAPQNESSRTTPQELNKAAWLIHEAKRPLIYAGGGVIAADATDVLTEFASLLGAPVCTSAMGIGGYPASAEANVGMIGMHGTAVANTLATECDFLIAIGARFSDRVISNAQRFAPDAKVLHIDIDPAEINKNIMTAYSLVGDVKKILSLLNPLLQKQERGEWHARVTELKQKYPTDYRKAEGLLKPQYVIQRLSSLAADKAIFVTEVGQHQMWSCQYLQIEKPRRFLTSGGLGTMGFGLGAAIGAAVANPDTPVINIAGDGCFRMNHIEIATAVEYELPLIEVIINNHNLGMVRQWQTMFYDKRYSQTSLRGKTTDFIKLADAYGAAAFNVTKPEEVDDAILKALALKKPVIINCEIGDDEKVFPMVPPGAGIDQYILEGGE
ncbi:MAG: biosynthetic-type acetolactate synthase large subunit [Defluviitaleaceae bacterium]|nr:biosynthetic-type acetolactate synthase large subunit [Defluviitaleaceae bacterium]MCL2263322.1 biosynthetic-type acetolactate synthase large subunit [Defluviitaleaceae bacterium]